MSATTLRAYCKLIQVDLCLSRGDFSALYRQVRNHPCRVNREYVQEDVRSVCRAVDMACIWYWKEVLCLQRSAATTCLLRDVGIPATMAIGVQNLPFRAHAWVELNNCVVNDKPYMTEMYAVLDRC